MLRNSKERLPGATEGVPAVAGAEGPAHADQLAVFNLGTDDCAAALVEGSMFHGVRRKFHGDTFWQIKS